LAQEYNDARQTHPAGASQLQRMADRKESNAAAKARALIDGPVVVLVSRAIALALVSSRAGAQSPPEPRRGGGSPSMRSHRRRAQHRLRLVALRRGLRTPRAERRANRILLQLGWTIDASKESSTVSLESSGTNAGLLGRRKSRVPANGELERDQPFGKPGSRIDVYHPVRTSRWAVRSIRVDHRLDPRHGAKAAREVTLRRAAPSSSRRA